MNMRAVIVVVSSLAMGASLNAQAQKQEPAARVQKAKPMVDWLATPLEGRVVKGMPYSAEIVTESVQTLGDGNRIVHRTTSRVYRDGEGRVRREEDRASASPIITITDPVARKSFTLDTASKTARETPAFGFFYFWVDGTHWQPFQEAWTLRPFPAIAGVDFARGRVGETYTTALGQFNRSTRAGVRGRDEYMEEPLPNRTIEGVVASGIRKTTTIPQGAIGNEQPIKTVSEEWTSVDLQVLVLTEVNDPRTGRTTYRLTNINRAEPDPALFKVPANYTRRFDFRPKTVK